MKLNQKTSWSIERGHYAPDSELVLVGGEYSANCPKCKNSIVHDSDAIFVDNPMGGKHWICITFHCEFCDYVWEDECQLQIDIQAKLISS